MLDVKRLRLLREFSIRGTVAEVADVLAYSPSAVSQQLALLERETGTKLLRKVGRGLVLTPAGERLAKETDKILTLIEQAQASLNPDTEEVTGRIRIASFQSAMISLIPSALHIISKGHPELRVEVVQHEPETALHETWARAFDIVIAEQYPGHSAPHFPGLTRNVLGSDDILLAVPKSGSFESITTIEQARAVPWVMEPVGAASRHWVEQACRVAGFEPDVRYETADIQAHLKFVATGNAVALVNGLAAQNATEQVRLLKLNGAPKRTIFTATREVSGAQPAVKVILKALEAVASELPIRM